MSSTTTLERDPDYYQEGGSEFFSPPTSPSQQELTFANVQRLARDEPVLPSVDLGLCTPPTSPPRKLAHATPDIEESAKDTISVDAACLKALLGPEKSRKCQSLKKGNSDTGSERCENFSPIKNRDSITSQIKAIVEVSWHTQELKHELRQLAKLVHCWRHNERCYTMQRADTWLRRYATGDVKIELDIQHALGTLSNQCVMFIDGKDRCKTVIGGKKLEFCRRTRQEIVNLRVDFYDANLDGLLEFLESNMYCIDHSPGDCFQLVASWKSGITGIRRVNSDSSSLQSAGKIASTTVESDSTTAIDEKISESQESLMPRSSRKSSLNMEEILESISNVDFDISPFDIPPFDIVEEISEHTETESSKQRIRAELRKPIVRPDFGKHIEETQTDIKVKQLLLENGDFGYVYIYEVDGNEGYIKIGYTTKDMKDRLQAWTFQCNRKAKVLYPRDVDKAVPVFHPKRVEALCHAELHDYRIKVNCNGCLATHNEWFKVSREVGVAVVEKWTRWMGTVPYENSGMKQSKGRMIHSWALKRGESARAQDFDPFIDHISAAVPSAVTSGLNTEKIDILVKATADLRI